MANIAARMEKCFFTEKLLYEGHDGRAPASRYISSHLKPGEMKGDAIPFTLVLWFAFFDPFRRHG
jgi:hypothetical protein